MGPGSGAGGTILTSGFDAAGREARERLGAVLRGALTVAVALEAEAAPAERLEVLRAGARRAAVLRGAALRVAGLRAAAGLRRAVPAPFLAPPAARRVVVDARRLVDAPRDAAPRAICCTCLLRASTRLSALSTSACLAACLT